MVDAKGAFVNGKDIDGVVNVDHDSNIYAQGEISA